MFTSEYERARLRAWMATSALCAAVFAGAPALAQQAAAPAETHETVSEIVVTAQKRSESVQSVPISVTAMDERKLERLGIQNLTDVARATPGLAVTSAGPGQNVLIIRGVSSTAGTAGTVGYYLDDTPIAASSNASLLAQRGLLDPSVFDISRIEVLHGPQGTLYGSSSMGGTIKYVTSQPDATRFSAKASATASYTEGGGPNGSINGMVNMPIVEDKLAARISAFYRYQDGFIDRYQIDPNDILKVKPNSPVKENVNTESTGGFRAQLLIKPDDTLTITPSIFYQYTRLGAPFQFDRPPGSFDNLIQTRDVSEVSDQRSLLGNIAIHKRLPFGEIVSSTSYYSRQIKINEDSSKVLAFFFSPPQTSVYPSVMTGIYRNREFTQELRFASDFQGPFQLIAGGYFHRTFAPLESAIPVPPGYDKTFGSPFGGTVFYHGIRKATLQESAAFAEASYDLGHGLTARAGLRAFQVDQRFYQWGEGVLNGGVSQVSNSSSDNGLNPKFNLSWQIDPDHMVYATASKGYRPGGPNNPAPAAVCGAEVSKLGLSVSQLTRYQPDTLWNYEAGAKTRWLDRKLTVNGSVYYIDWSDVQQQIVLNCGFNITANFGKATSKGAELEVEYHPLPGLSLNAAAGYTDATLSNDIPGTPARKGDPLQDVPHWNLAGGVEYAKSFSNGFNGFGRLDVNYTSDALALYDRTSPFHERKGFVITNVKLGIDNGDHWQAVFFVDNLFDKIGQTGLPAAIGADLPTTRRIAVNRPRTVGVTLSYKY